MLLVPDHCARCGAALPDLLRRNPLVIIDPATEARRTLWVCSKSCGLAIYYPSECVIIQGVEAHGA